MKLDYWMIFLLIPLVGAILAMIVIAPEDIPQPKIQPEIATEKSTQIESEPSTSSKVPAPGFENVPEMIIQEESISIEEELGKTEPEAMVKEREPSAADKVEVNIPTGSSIPGCEETMKCFIPSSVTVTVGGTVTWFNGDTAAHTVTSGTTTDGPDGIFDSSLFLADASFSHTFEEEGAYDYFCIVHPWMTGTVKVS
jgi:plastocyanin